MSKQTETTADTGCSLERMARRPDWVKCSDQLPPQDIVVETKIDDGRGVRNLGMLRRYKALWFTPDNAMYVYYTPTHWRGAL